MRTIRPISELGTRVPEAGKIRLGIKVPNKDPKKRANPKAIDTFRFTSPYRDVIDQLAELYGGEPREWDEPTAKLRNQWEVRTEAKLIDVLVPPGGLSQHYELWSGGGCARRCNGVLCEVPSKAPDEDVESVPCICTEDQRMECVPKTRMTLVLPNVTFRGVWLLESSSWNAAEELVGMERLLQQIQQVTTITEAELSLQQRTSKRGGQTKHFVVPVLTLPYTPQAIGAGAASFLDSGPQAALGSARAALDAPTTVDDGFDRAQVGDVQDSRIPNPDDDEAIDAEIVYSPEDIATRAAELANELILDPHKLLVGLCLGISRRARPDEAPVTTPEELMEPELARAGEFLDDVAAGRVEVTSFNEDGTMNIKRPKGT